MLAILLLACSVFYVDNHEKNIFLIFRALLGKEKVMNDFLKFAIAQTAIVGLTTSISLLLGKSGNDLNNAIFMVMLGSIIFSFFIGGLLYIFSRKRKKAPEI